MDAGTEQRIAEAARATALGDQILPDPTEERLSQYRASTLLVLAVVAHSHGTSAKQIRRATGQSWINERISLRSLRRAGLVELEPRAGPDRWFATQEGTQLGVTPYVTRMLATGINFYHRWQKLGFSLSRFNAIGTEHGPPMFRPSVVLADVNDPQALAEVIRKGVHEDRAFALTKLIALRDPSSVPILLEVAERRGDEELLAREATVALGSFDTAASIDALIGLADHRDSYIREAAAHGLGRLGAKQAIPTLVRLFDYPNEPVRAAAARALERIGDRSAAPGLAAALQDSDGTVRRFARHALIELGASEELASDPSRLRPLRWLDTRRAAGWWL